MKNLLIEGLQGAGKSTLLEKLSLRLPNLHICREGDYCPIELAWCAWMTKEEYGRIIKEYESLKKEIERNTVWEGDHAIVSYTRILTDLPGFHKKLEQYEIYHGRKSLAEMEEIILSRYQRFSGTDYLFECVFMQNTIEDFILFHQLEDDEILAFYQKLYDRMEKDNFLLLYLFSENIEENIKRIRKERSDEAGNELWYDLMLQYLIQSPYGQKHKYQGFDDLISHLRHRQQIELRIIKEIVKENAIILPAKSKEMEAILEGHLL